MSYIPPTIYERHATVTKVVDGDTLHLDADLGCDVTLRLTVRAYGINAPEMGTDAGVAARDFAAEWLGAHGPVFSLLTVKDRREKYGRYLADLVPLSGGETWCEAMLRTGNAVHYLP